MTKTIASLADVVLLNQQDELIACLEDSAGMYCAMDILIYGKKLYVFDHVGKKDDVLYYREADVGLVDKHDVAFTTNVKGEKDVLYTTDKGGGIQRNSSENPGSPEKVC